jgi:hypothetical protein
VVKARVEGLSFLVLMSSDTGGCHLCTPINYMNRNTIFSSNYMLQMFILFSMGKFAIHVNELC